MLAYSAAHLTDDVPFRCVACERLTKHSADGIIPHLVAAHNIPERELSIDKDGCVFHTPRLATPPPMLPGSALAGDVLQYPERAN